MSEAVTPERLAELRRIAEAAVPGKWSGQDFQMAMPPRTVLALLDEIDHLRKQRDTLISAISNIAGNVLALLDRIEELEAVLRLVYDEFVLDVARWCRHCRLRIDDHEPECPMAEVERVLGLAGGATDA